MANPPIVYVDTETTGLDPRRHEVFEFAAIKGGEELVLWFEIDITKADPGALRINNYYLRRGKCWEKYGSSLKEGALRIAQFTTGCLLAGSNVGSFDLGMIEALLRRAGLVPAWSYRPLDVVDYAYGVLGLEGLGSLRKAAEKLGIEREEGNEAHTGLADARFAKAVHETAIALAQRSVAQEDLEVRLKSIFESWWPDVQVTSSAEKLPKNAPKTTVAQALGRPDIAAWANQIVNWKEDESAS